MLSLWRAGVADAAAAVAHARSEHEIAVDECVRAALNLMMARARVAAANAAAEAAAAAERNAMAPRPDAIMNRTNSTFGAGPSPRGLTRRRGADRRASRMLPRRCPAALTPRTPEGFRISRRSFCSGSLRPV